MCFSPLISLIGTVQMRRFSTLSWVVSGIRFDLVDILRGLKVKNAQQFSNYEKQKRGKEDVLSVTVNYVICNINLRDS